MNISVLVCINEYQFGLCLLVVPCSPHELEKRHVSDKYSSLLLCLFIESFLFREDEEEMRSEFSIPGMSVGFLIGKGGETLRALEEEFRLHIHVEKMPKPDNRRTVVIIGTNAEAICRAKDRILQMTGLASV